MQYTSSNYFTSTGAVLLGLTHLAVAHGSNGDMKIEMGEPVIARPTIPVAGAAATPVSYFQHGEYSGLIVSHILLMTVAWVFVLPVGRSAVAPRACNSH
jgi:hypothetical protein